MRSWGLCLVLAACGYAPSAATGDAAGDDAASDGTTPTDGSPDAMLAPCGYTEQADATNNTGPGAVATGLTFSSPMIVCGQVDTSHFVSPTVDVDAYRVNLAAPSDVLLHLTGTGIEGLERTVVQLTTTGGAAQLAFGTFVGNHATLRATLPAGDVLIGVRADNLTDIATAIPYRLAMVADQPDTRCPKGAPTTYTEANDGASNDGNDMVSFDLGAMPQRRLTGVADSPEPAGSSAPKLHIVGTAADVDASDSYQDRDTYEFTTGATTRQLSIRLNWTGTGDDLDFLALFANTPQSFGGGLSGGTSEDEFDTFAAEPNTTYWVWVGAFDGAAQLPKDYEVTICNEEFTAP